MAIRVPPAGFVIPEGSPIQLRPVVAFPEALAFAQANGIPIFDPTNIPATPPGGWAGPGGSMAVSFSNGFVMPGDYSAGLPGQPSSGFDWGSLIQAGASVATSIINRAQNGSVMQQMPATTRVPSSITSQYPIQDMIDAMNKITSTSRTLGNGRGFDVNLPAGGQRAWPTNRDGTPRRAKKNGMPWKRPSMNVANPHALRRSFRRVDGFATLAKKTITFVKTHHLKKRGKR